MKKIAKKILSLIFIFIISMAGTSAQNLLQERIRRISEKKKSVYIDSGIFHNGGPKLSSKLKTIRHNYSSKNGYERVVMDFKTDELPRVYGHISSAENKLYLDLFQTNLESSLSNFGDSKFVKSINFFPIQKDTLSVEVIFKKNVTLDVFYLSRPGRLVIDIKG